MTVDQSLTPVALDRGEASSWFGFLSAEEINEAPFNKDPFNKGRSGELENDPGSASGSLKPSPAFPGWPRVYPGL